MEKNIFKKGDWRSFLSFRGEKILFAKRKHPLVLLEPIFLAVVTAVILIVASFFLFTSFLSSISLFILGSMLIVSLSTLIIGQTIVRWYFHLYILTDRKILEVWYTPLFSHVVYEILLDKVNCTEIDFGSKGFLRELMDVGDVMITFDRPTHQEQFIIKDVKNCDRIGRFLIGKLLDRKTETGGEMIWVKSRSGLIPRTI